MLEKYLENPNFVPIISILVLLGLVVFSSYLPEAWRSTVVVGAYAFVVVFMLSMDWIARIQVASYNCLLTVIRLPDGNKVKKWIYLSPSTESSTLKEREIVLENGTKWYGFRLQPKPFNLPGYGSVDDLVLLSRATWDDTYHFVPTPNWASWMGQIVDHSHGEFTELYLYPHPHDEFQKKIPMFFVVTGGGKSYFPWAIRNWNLGLDEEPVATGKEMLLQGRVVTMEYENRTLREHIDGLTKIPMSVDKAANEKLLAMIAYQEDIRKAVPSRRSRIKFDITTVIIAAIILAGLAYLYFNPQVVTYLYLTAQQNMLYIIVILVIVFLIIYFLGRRKKG